jgi:hypothetical protein
VAVLATETWPGASGAAWPAQWTTAAVNSGSATQDAGRGKLQAFATSGSAAKAYLSGMAAVRDVDVTVDVEVSALSLTWFLAVRANDAAASSTPTTAYRLQMHSDGGLRLVRNADGASNYVVTSGNAALPGVGTWTARVPRRVRFAVIGTTVRVKTWAPSDTEPTAWQLEWTDPAPGSLATATGKLWFCGRGPGTSGEQVWFDDLTVTDGVAPGAGTLALGGAGTLALRGSGPGRGQLELGGRGGRLELWQSQDVTTLGPDRAPHLAVEVHADLGGQTLTLDDDALDSDQLLGWGPDADRGWSNVVCDVRSATVRRGVTRSQGVLTRAEAGQLDLVLADPGRRFDPYAAGDVYPGTAIRLRAWGFTEDWQLDAAGELQPVRTRWSQVLFTGVVDTVAVSYVKDGAPLVTLSAPDLIGQLVRYEQDPEPAPGVGARETLRQRAERVLAQAGHAGRLSPVSDYGYATTLAPTTLGGSAWAELTAAADAELGRVWADRHNRLAVFGRQTPLTGPLRGTLSDVHGELVGGAEHCCYDDALAVADTTLLINRAKARRRVWEPTADGGRPVEAVEASAEDGRSRHRHGVHAIDSTLEVATDRQAARWVRDVIAADSVPELRVDTVTPRPDGHMAAWPHVAATDLGDRWAFLLRPTTGPPLVRTLGVLGIEHRITPEGWDVTFATAEAPEVDPFAPDGWWRVDDSDLDGPDLLAPYDGDPATWVLGDIDGGRAVAAHTGPPVDGGAARRTLTGPPVDGGGA